MSERLQNVTGTDTCPHCVDGLSVVHTRPARASIVRVKGKPERREPRLGGAYEEYGPCPYCEAGFRVEFPKDGPRIWRRGYWQGRDPSVIDPPPHDPMPLPDEENLLRLQLLAARFQQVKAGMDRHKLADPCIGLESGLSDRERLLVCREAVSRLG